jgi:hypothetical protein
MTTSSREEDKTSVKHKVYKMRGRYFLILVPVLLFYCSFHYDFCLINRFR